MECLNNIIGITNSTCACVLDGLTPEQKEVAKLSTSGLYLDGNLEGGVHISDVKMLEHCEEYYRLATKAITAAKKAFEDDIQVAVQTKYKTNKAKFIGELGRLQYSGFLSVAEPLQFLRLVPKQENAAVMKINNVRLNISAAKEVNVKLIAVIDGLTYGDTIFEATVTTQASRFTSVAIPENLKVPLTINNRKINYYFIWQKTGVEMPINNGVSCGCSGGDAYKNYVELRGGGAQDIDNLGEGTDRNAHGFSVDAELFCETGDLICNEYNKNNIVAIVVAWSNLYKAGELLIEYIMQSPEINRFTMMNREYLWGKRNHFKKEYENRIMWLATNIEITTDDCFVCRDTKAFVGNVFG